MNAKHSTAPAPTDTRSIARSVRSMRMEAFTLSVLALGVVIGAVLAAVWFGVPWLALLGLVAIWPALSAYYLNEGATREAEHLPPKPKRAGPHWLRRLWWWFVRHQVQRAARPKPWRGVKVDGVEDAVKLPRQPQEMAQEKESLVVHGYTASDVYRIVCLAASTRGLSEREWQKQTQWREQLPSGRQLTREGFRDVQQWLVKHKLAVSQPAYQLTVTPEAVATELEKER